MVQFTWIVCCRCKVDFAVDAATYTTLKKSGASFHCPFGHSQHFSEEESEESKLRRENQRLKQNAAYLEDQRREAEERALHERNRANGYKGHATRITKRAKAGLCPCCNRSFVNMARHMATKHPQFTPLEVIDGGKVDAA